MMDLESLGELDKLKSTISIFMNVFNCQFIFYISIFFLLLSFYFRIIKIYYQKIPYF